MENIFHSFLYRRHLFKVWHINAKFEFYKYIIQNIKSAIPKVIKLLYCGNINRRILIWVLEIIRDVFLQQKFWKPPSGPPKPVRWFLTREKRDAIMNDTLYPIQYIVFNWWKATSQPPKCSCPSYLGIR